METGPRDQRTVWQAVAGLSIRDALAYGGVVLVIVGCIGTWVNVGIASASGFNGDGKWMALFALLVGFGYARGLRRTASFGFAVLLVWAVLEIVHIHHEASNITLLGEHFVHVGWGLYVAAVGAFVGLASWGEWVRTAQVR